MRRRFVPLLCAGIVLPWSPVAAQNTESPPPPSAAASSSNRVEKAPAAKVTSAEWLARAREVGAKGLIKQAIEFAGRAAEADPRDPRPYFYRAQLHERTRQFAAAEADLTRCLDLAPGDAALHLNRGITRLRLADFAGAVADFDRVAELRPAQAPQLWQRGIALFYAGRYDDARRQFESHRVVNPSDVENSAWHFACLAKTVGVEAARNQWMPVEGDTRVPMNQIQALMNGTGTAPAVLLAAEAIQDDERRLAARFYAELYLALYYGAEGRRDLEARHATTASKLASPFGIMGDIAVLHADWVARELAKPAR